MRGPAPAKLAAAIVGLCIWILAVGCHRQTAPAPGQQAISFVELRAQHPTRLRRRAPSPGSYTQMEPPPGAERVSYKSDGRELWGWLALPDSTADASPAPALVYFHGAFSLSPRDFENVEFLVERGFVVFTPTLRGENGNPGSLELLAGELDDAIAAVEFVAARPEVDRDRIYAIGHSVGGALSALLSLVPDLPLRETASVGGIYVPETFQRWTKMKSNAGLVRFDPFDPNEGRLRTLGGNVQYMVRPHVAYIGDGDRWFHPNARGVARKATPLGAPFELVFVPGDHASSLPVGLSAYAERIAEAP